MINKWVIISVLVGFVLFFGLTNKNIQEDIIVYFPNDEDFSNSNQGTAIFKFSFPQTGFKVGDALADSLMFLDSKTIPNLRISYNQKEKRLYAGKPPLITDEVVLLDGKDHRIEYSFDKNQKIQSISLDGVLLASGEFSTVTVLTGYVIHNPVKIVESDFPIEVSFK